MSDNPYASPTTESITATESVSEDGELRIASQGKRFVNFFVDNIIVQVFSGIAGFAIGIAYATSQVPAGRGMTVNDEASWDLIGFFIGLGISLTYYVSTEVLFERTLAKFLTGTIVVTEDGSRPSFGQIFGRSLARFVPFEAFSFLGGKRPVGWHDRWSGTRVIETR